MNDAQNFPIALMRGFDRTGPDHAAGVLFILALTFLGLEILALTSMPRIALRFLCIGPSPSPILQINPANCAKTSRFADHRHLPWITKRDVCLGEIRFFSTTVNTVDSVLRLTKRLAEAGKVPTFCYEAGPGAYGLFRHLTKLDFECAVVAPGMIPRKVGDREQRIGFVRAPKKLQS